MYDITEPAGSFFLETFITNVRSENEGRDQLMKKTGEMDLQKLIDFFRVALCFVFFLAACTNQEPEDPKENNAPEEPITNEKGGWQVPGLVDQSGKQLELPVPDPATGRSLDVTDFGADPLPYSPDDAAAIRKAISAAEPAD